MSPESRFKIRVLAVLKQIPDLYVIKIQQVGLRGCPDIFMCYQGKFVAWELKVPPNKVKAGSLQEFYLEQIQKAGGIAREVTPANINIHLEELKCLNLSYGSKASSNATVQFPL